MGRQRLDSARDRGGAPVGADDDPHPAVLPRVQRPEAAGGRGSGRVAAAAAGAGSDDGGSPASAQSAPAAEVARPDGGKCTGRCAIGMMASGAAKARSGSGAPDELGNSTGDDFDRLRNRNRSWPKSVVGRSLVSLCMAY